MLKTAENEQVITSSWAKLALAMLAIMWSAAGWWILVAGGFTQSFRHTKTTIYVDGPLAIFMAYLFFVLAVVACWAAIQSRKPSVFAYAAIAVAIVGMPTLYLIFR